MRGDGVTQVISQRLTDAADEPADTLLAEQHMDRVGAQRVPQAAG
jgi:hypothetical protein